MATPALTRTEERREPARGRAAAAAGAEERRRAGAGLFLSLKKKEQKERYLVLSRRAKEREGAPGAPFLPQAAAVVVLLASIALPLSDHFFSLILPHSHPIVEL